MVTVGIESLAYFLQNNSTYLQCTCHGVRVELDFCGVELVKHPGVVECFGLLPFDPDFFLGGLSLHLNYLIASCTVTSFLAIWDTSHWNFLSNLDTRHLMHLQGPL